MLRDRSVVFSRIVRAHQEVQRCSVRLDGVISETASENGSQIQFLQSVGLEIRAHEGKQPGVKFREYRAPP